MVRRFGLLVAVCNATRRHRVSKLSCIPLEMRALLVDGYIEYFSESFTMTDAEFLANNWSSADPTSTSQML